MISTHSPRKAETPTLLKPWIARSDDGNWQVHIQNSHHITIRPIQLKFSSDSEWKQVSSVPAMILVAIVAELLEEYTALVARVLEQLLNDAPFPRRMRFLMLRSLPFVPPPLPPPPPQHALRVTTRA
ncbi:hypothetical protein BAE44_0018272 [Dichanthelium oligosanthes]|uniref:Uncharacterized protein n=1 Tax=Dichanthelium oligosanthes TaxID=888268 RepID=A0A1E5V6D2_9POAL|nr:hypothetical protein BAE44_0018272 [Dichanthelium oligosanthes]